MSAYAEQIRVLPGFEDVDQARLEALTGFMQHSTMAPGTMLLREGESVIADAPAAFLLLRGEVAVERDGRGVIRVLGPGALFGALAVADRGKRSASCIALGEVEVLSITGTAFTQCQDTAPEAACELELLLSRQIARDLKHLNTVLARALDRPDEVIAGLPTGPKRMVIESYSGFQSMQCEVHTPRDRKELTATLAAARREGRKVVLRGAGLSFDGHALGTDMAIDTRALRSFRFFKDTGHFEVGAGTSWGSVVHSLLATGNVAPFSVSGSDITVAGTLSANSMSRFTPAVGKEGKWVESIELLTPRGTVLTCSRSENAHLFYAAIGGWGGAGAILSARYRSQHVGTPTRVRTSVTRVTDMDQLAPMLMPDASKPNQTVYGVVAWKGDEPRAMICHSSFEKTDKLDTMLPHRPSNALRVPIEWAINRVGEAGQVFWNVAFSLYVREDRPYYDDLEAYTFFMDGHARARNFAHELNVPFRVAQQAFVLPGSNPRALKRFILESAEQLKREGHQISMVDVLYLPPDEPFLLSSSWGLSGWVITFTFEGDVNYSRLGGAMREMSETTHDLGGRVHLTKNVMARSGTLERMYRDGLTAYAKIRDEIDPDHTLGSDFLSRMFPTYF